MPIVDLNQPCKVETSEFREVEYLVARYMYTTPDGTLAHGKNGINVPIQWTPKLLQAMIDVYNETTGSSLQLIGENAVPDPELDAA